MLNEKPSMKKYTFLFCLFLNSLCFSQKQKVICDVITKKPLEGVFLANYAENIIYITDNNGSIPMDLTPKKLKVTHPRYQSLEVSETEWFGKDTLFLTEPFRNKKYKKSNKRELKDANVFAELNSLIKKQRKTQGDDTVFYLTYLQSTKEDSKMEEMKSIIQLRYYPRFGFRSSYPNVLAGEFKFNEQTNFLNYQTQNWVQDMHPFSEKPNTLEGAMPSQIDKLTPEYFELKFKTLDINGWEYRLVDLKRKVDGVEMQFLYQVNGLQIHEVRLHDGAKNRRNVMRTTSDVKGITDLSMVYHFQNNAPAFIQFAYTLDVDSNWVTRGFWRKMDDPKLGKVVTVGNFDLIDPYTQISILPQSNTAKIDSVFKVISNYSFDYFNEQIYVSSNPLVQEGILKSFTSTREWSNRRLDINSAKRNFYKLDLATSFDFYRFARTPERWLVIWPVQKSEKNGKNLWTGRSSVWLETGEIYRYFEDDSKQALVFNLIFDYYEADRLKAMKEVALLGEEEFLKKLNLAFSKTFHEVSFMLNEIDLRFKRYQAMFMMNEKIKADLKLDNFLMMFNSANQYSVNNLHQMDFISSLHKAAVDQIHTDEILKKRMLEEVIFLYQHTISILLKNKSTNIELFDSVFELMHSAYKDASKQEDFCDYVENLKVELGSLYSQSKYLKTICIAKRLN